MTPPATAKATAVPAAPSRRFFVTGDGTLAVVNAHTAARAAVTYRTPDGAYDPAALASLRRGFASRDGREGPLSLRLIEVLAALQDRGGGRDLVLISGYRSPDYNEAIRRRGAKAASGSLHTEGLAADVALPGTDVRALWETVRGLDCCGAGLYVADGFVHVDVGRPRFWEPATSRVDENLSAGNARIFARTEYDRYAAGEPIVATLHGITSPPVLIARTAHVVTAAGPVAVQVDDGSAGKPCIALADATDAFLVLDVPAGTDGTLELRACNPRTARTPPTVPANRIVVGVEL